MWIAAFALAVTLFSGRVSLTANDVPLPEAMKAIAVQLGSRLEMAGDLSDLRLSLQFRDEEPARAVERIVEGWPVDYYLLGQGEAIILHRRGSAGGPSVIFAPSAAPAAPMASPREVEVDRAVDFLSKLGQLTPEETQRLRQELMRNW